MKSFSSHAIKTGITAGVILIFCEMINLTSTLAMILEKSFRNVRSVRVVSPNFLIAVIAIIIFLVAFSFSRKNIAVKGAASILPRVEAGLLIALVSGGMISILNIILGSYLDAGVDLRKYLESISPDTIRTFLFQSTIQQAVVIYMLTALGASLLGMLISWIVQETNQPAKLFNAVGDWISELQIPKKIEKYPLLKAALIVALVAFIFAFPLIVDSYMISVFGIVCIYAMLGLGLNLIVGLSGQLVFGYVAFYAIGAYTFALLTAPKPFGVQMHFLLAFFFALVLSGIGGALVGLPIMNLRGDYLAIVTLGFAEIVRILINSNLLADYTGGPQGVKAIGQPTQPDLLTRLFGKPLDGNVWFLYIIIFCTAVVIYIAYRLQYSHTGRSWEAMREDETVAQACGVNTSSYKVLSIIIGAVIAGAAGAVYASRNTYIGPGDFNFMVSVNALAVVVVGGMGSIPGALLGAFIIKGLPELLRDLDSYRMVVFGALLVIMMVIRPEGILPVKRRNLSVKPESIEVLKKELKP